MEEEGTRIALTVVNTPGFGDQIDNEAGSVPPIDIKFNIRRSNYLPWLLSFAEIISYIERQYDEILAVDCRIKRKPRFQDTRVHALLYFITPTGHGYVPLIVIR